MPLPTDYRIGFVLDYSCPWCFIGFRHLATALASAGKTPHEYVQILPYQLHPELPIEGINRDSFTKKAQKGTGQLVKNAAKEAGIDHIIWPSLIPNTALAHRVICHLGQKEQWEGAKTLFTAYWEHNLPISTMADLGAVLPFHLTIQRSQDHSNTAMTNFVGSQPIMAVPSYILPRKQVLSGIITAQRWSKYFAP